MTDQVASVRYRQGPQMHGQLLEGHSIQILHDQYVVIIDLPSIVSSHDVGMIQLCHSDHFSLESRDQAFVLQVFVSQNLQRDDPFGLLVARPEHPGFTALAEISQHFVARQLRPRARVGVEPFTPLLTRDDLRRNQELLRVAVLERALRMRGIDQPAVNELREKLD